jgi:hypothetical protein
VTKITFSLQPIGDSSPLPRPVLEADGLIRVKQLNKFIAHQLDQLDTMATIQTLCDDVPLGDELSVIFVKKFVWIQAEDTVTLSYQTTLCDFR